MSLIIYVDGQFVRQEDAKVSVFDHGFLYGDGIFEGIRAYSGVVRRLPRHITRLYDSAKTVKIDIPISPEEMTEAVLETIRRNKLKDSYIRLVVSRGFGDLGLDPRKCSKASVIIIAATISLYPPEMYEKGLEVVITSTRKCRQDMLSPRVKSLNYLNNIMAKLELIRQGMAEGIMLNSEGYVAEATADNVFIVKDGILHTPPKNVGCLEGVTRNMIIDIAKAQGIEVRETLLVPHDLYCADEFFLTGTGAEVIPVVRIDARQVGTGVPGEMTRRLTELFREQVKWDGTPIYK